MLFSIPDLDERELGVVRQIAQLRETLSYAMTSPKKWFGVLRRNVFAKAIRGSNSIEGYHVTADDAVAAVDGAEPIDPKDEAWFAVVGYRNAMTYVLQTTDDSSFAYSTGLLKSLHFMMVGHDLAKNPGRWRPGPIYVRDDSTGEQVYEGPPMEMVEPLVEELVTQLNSDTGVDRMVLAAMAHLNLVMIHPFSDGNGRMGRGLQTLVLAQSGIMSPIFASIEEYLGRNTVAYYEVLARVGQGSWHPERDAKPWIRFCLTAHYVQAKTLLRRTRQIQKLFDGLEEMVKELGLPERMVYALADAAMGVRVRNPTYRELADVTPQVAKIDLARLAKEGLLVPVGEKRGRYYVASPPIIRFRDKVAESRVLIEDPFAERLAG